MLLWECHNYDTLYPFITHPKDVMFLALGFIMYGFKGFVFKVYGWDCYGFKFKDYSILYYVMVWVWKLEGLGFKVLGKLWECYGLKFKF